MRQTLGTAVFSGMLGVTLFGIFLTPVFFYVIEGFGETRTFCGRPNAAVGSAMFGGLAGLVARLLVVEGRLASAWRGALAGASSLGVFSSFWSRSCGALRRQANIGDADNDRTTTETEPDLNMISHFFIDRPIFASVLSIIITLAGGVAVFTLPVAQYPEITPPTVLVTAIYPGPTPKRCATPWPRRSSNKSTASRTCCTCRRSVPTTARTADDHVQAGHRSDMAQVLVQNRVAAGRCRSFRTSCSGRA